MKVENPFQTNNKTELLYTPLNFELTEIITASKKIDIKKKISFPLQNGHFEKISSNWKKAEKINSITNGIENLGNTCYLNSVLQVFLNTPFLFYYNKRNKMSKIHKCKKIKNNNFCLECMILEFYDKSRKKTLYPSNFVNSLKFLNKKFVRGRQQDSHEFYLLVLNSVSDFFKKIFLGKLTSRVTCPKNHISDVEEPFLNLSLSIQNANSIKNSLKKYFQPLKNIKSYNCQKCKKKREITKQYIIKTAPKILTLHINRFNNFGKKLTKHINFDLSLNLFQKTYNLYAIVDHIGSSLKFGHYVSYIKSASNIWYRMNDSSVNIVNNNVVKRLRPYILFYCVVGERKSSFEERKRLRRDSIERRVSREVDVGCLEEQGDQGKGVEDLDIERIFDLEMFRERKGEMERRGNGGLRDQGNLEKENEVGRNGFLNNDEEIVKDKNNLKFEEENEKSKLDVNEEVGKKNKMDFDQKIILKKIELVRSESINTNEDYEDYEEELYIKKKNEIKKEKSKFYEKTKKNEKILKIDENLVNEGMKKTNKKMRLEKKMRKMKKLKFSKRFNKLKKIVKLNKYFKTKNFFSKLDEENTKEKVLYEKYLEIQKDDPENFGVVKKRKDSYDVEYDMGKVKKIKKKTIKEKRDFFKIYKKKFVNN